MFTKHPYGFHRFAHYSPHDPNLSNAVDSTEPGELRATHCAFLEILGDLAIRTIS